MDIAFRIGLVLVALISTAALIVAWLADSPPDSELTPAGYFVACLAIVVIILSVMALMPI